LLMCVRQLFLDFAYRPVKTDALSSTRSAYPPIGLSCRAASISTTSSSLTLSRPVLPRGQSFGLDPLLSFCRLKNGCCAWVVPRPS
jgi:hypothetical protein